MRSSSSTDDNDRLVDALAMAIRWLPFGGVDSYEIFVTLGVSPARFGLMLEEAVASCGVMDRAGLGADDKARLSCEIDRVKRMPWRIS